MPTNREPPSSLSSNTVSTSPSGRPCASRASRPASSAGSTCRLMRAPYPRSAPVTPAHGARSESRGVDEPPHHDRHRRQAEGDRGVPWTIAEREPDPSDSTDQADAGDDPERVPLPRVDGVRPYLRIDVVAALVAPHGGQEHGGQDPHHFPDGDEDADRRHWPRDPSSDCLLTHGQQPITFLTAGQQVGSSRWRAP